MCPNFNLVNNLSQTLSTFYIAEIEYFSRLNCFISNGRPGHLQFYSYSSDKLLFNVSVSIYILFCKFFKIFST